MEWKLIHKGLGSETVFVFDKDRDTSEGFWLLIYS